MCLFPHFDISAHWPCSCSKENVGGLLYVQVMDDYVLTLDTMRCARRVGVATKVLGLSRMR